MNRILFAPRWLVSALFLLPPIVDQFEHLPRQAMALLVAMQLALVLFWCADLIEFLEDRTRSSSKLLRYWRWAAPWFVAACYLLALVEKFPKGTTADTVVTVLFLLSVFSILAIPWFAARELNRAELMAGARRRSQFATWLQILSLPIGIWMLWPRITQRRRR